MLCDLVSHVSTASSNNVCFIPTCDAMMQFGNPCFPFQFFCWCFATCICVDVRPGDQFDFNSLESLHTIIQAFTNVFNCHCIDCVESWSYYQYKFITVIFPSLSLSLISSFLFNFFYPSLFTSTSWSQNSKNTKQEQGSKKIEVNDLLLSFLVLDLRIFLVCTTEVDS